MKKTIFLIAVLFFSLFAFSQSKTDSTAKVKDTVNITGSKVFIINGRQYSTEGISKVSFFLTKEMVESLVAEIGTLPFNESEKAIAIIRKIFGLK